MKKVLFIIAIFIATGISAQTKYQTGMQKAFGLWQQNKLTEASQLFERISKAEPDNWLPAYYAATVEIIGSFGMKDEAALTAKLTKAQEFVDVAKAISANNPEIIITQAFLNLGYIAFDGQKYGMTLGGKNSMLYAKALEISPENPRVILANAEWNMGSAKFFGKSTKPYCAEIERAIELGKKEKIEQEFYPKFQVKRAEEVLKQCQG
ncbi:hypothetical protein BW723_00710 [Polaribacter reichenbachii]|uniref:Tetratricopeptide repeat protein n=1 Tax=Polaribacter reichenbachii TaxID=996801 RepID=A0A1B8U4W3_9FLAO|nr:hypothetical protein [Polaribacter reichenbachii]APZ44894.1 hypothetical protein BW723_00710 [Polaribacter reichenbachii]AUC18758.1 hypothetical protein BTO17_08715 [Polaribacter reichenbachii]OBY66874.1 hypothetical protein LPB301_05455 [Polaribacter reichenbachii]